MLKFILNSNKQVMVEVEREFELEFPDEDVERFRNVHDVVEFVSRSFFAK